MKSPVDGGGQPLIAAPDTKNIGLLHDGEQIRMKEFGHGDGLVLTAVDGPRAGKEHQKRKQSKE